MKSSFTGKGMGWEWKHSLWMLWTLVPFGYTSFISFFYIGKNTKSKKWMIFGLIYLAYTLFTFFIWFGSIGDMLRKSIESTVNSSVSYSFDMIMFFVWVWTITHVFLVRKEYLIKLSYISDHPEIKEKCKQKYYDSVTKEYRKDNTQPVKRVITMPKKEESTVLQNEIKEESRADSKNLSETLIDINKCSTDDLLNLPGFSLPLAKKVVDKRNNEGYFSSIDEFLDFIMVKPHFAVAIREKITTSDFKKDQSKSSPKRNVDF